MLLGRICFVSPSNLLCTPPTTFEGVSDGSVHPDLSYHITRTQFSQAFPKALRQHFPYLGITSHNKTRSNFTPSSTTTTSRRWRQKRVINEQDYSGHTPLFLSAIHYTTPEILHLFSAGANPNINTGAGKFYCTSSLHTLHPDQSTYLSGSVPNHPGPLQGPADGLPRALDGTGRRNMSRPRP